MNERVKPFEDKMNKTLEVLKEEYASVRAGRANPHLLDKLRVDYYGTPSPIQSVANISVPEARVIQIQPWEAKMIKEIEKAILASDIGITPGNDGKIIRLVFPELRLQFVTFAEMLTMLSRRLQRQVKFLKMSRSRLKTRFRSLQISL